MPLVDMRGFPASRRSVQTAVLVAVALGAAVWIDLSVLGSGRPGDSEMPSAMPEEVIVDVTVPGSPVQGTVPPEAGPARAATELAGAPTDAAPAQAAPPAGPSAAPGQPVPAAPQVRPTPTPAPSPSAAPRPSAPTAPTPPAQTPTTTRPPQTTTSTTQAPPTATYQTATYAGVGDVVVADTNGRLEFWSCSAAPGWGYRVEKNGPTTVEVKFRRTNGEGEAKIEIRRRSDGSLSIKRED